MNDSLILQLSLSQFIVELTENKICTNKTLEIYKSSYINLDKTYERLMINHLIDSMKKISINLKEKYSIEEIDDIFNNTLILISSNVVALDVEFYKRYLMLFITGEIDKNNISIEEKIVLVENCTKQLSTNINNELIEVDYYKLLLRLYLSEEVFNISKLKEINEKLKVAIANKNLVADLI